METISPIPLKAELSDEEIYRWEKTLEAGVLAQKLVKSSIAVGGTAAMIYAGHRVSFDTDHLLLNLRDEFDEILDKLSSAPEWKTARLNRPVLILGNINDCEVRFRQSRRINPPIEVVKVRTDFGDLVIPTLDEMIGMKAFLSYQRKTVRDFLDFAALSTCTNDAEVIASLMKLDDRYGEFQTNSIRLEVARNFAEPNPVDLEKIDLSHYKGLAAEWHDWTRTREICRKFAMLLGEAIFEI